MNGKSLTYLIIGCGHFGRRAAERLLQKNPRPKIIIVDQNKEALQEASHLPVESAVCEGTLYLKQYLSKGRKTDYIVPAVPFHLAFEYILSQLKSLGGKKKKSPSPLRVAQPHERQNRRSLYQPCQLSLS